MRVAVMGGGNAAFALAATLAVEGHEVGLCECPEFEGTLAVPRERQGIELESPDLRIRSGFARLAYVGTEADVAVAGASIVLVAVPAYGEERFGSILAEHVTSEHLVVLCCGNLGSALLFARRLGGTRGAALPLLMEIESFIYSGHKTGPGRVRITGRKRGLAAAAYPAGRTPVALARLAGLFPDLVPARNVLETGLRNLNLVVHAPISLLNAGRTDGALPRFRYYWDGVTAAVGRVIEAVDAERLAVGHALGIDLPDVKHILLGWYGDQGATGETIAEILGRNPAYRDILAPQSLEHRFITEDVPYNMVPLEGLAAALGVATPVTTALIEVASSLLARDLRREGRRLDWSEFLLNGEGLGSSSWRSVLGGR
jgi:opine dehydrogenase